jgi:site-specific recombinase XerD
MESLFEQFIKERKYLKGISPRTEFSYNNARRALFRHYGCDVEVLSKSTLNDWVVRMREAGLSPGACNVYIRTVNAFLKWAHLEHNQPLIRLEKVKEAQKIIAAFSPEHVSRILRWKPSERNGPRLKALILTALDSGLRVHELLALRRSSVDLDNLVLRVKGKGNKERLVPISLELRKVIFRHLSTHPHELLFCTRDGGPVGQRNLLRDFKAACHELGITGVRASFHTLRHTFAVSYLRAGGNLFYLSKILGHSSVTTTQKYLQSVGVDDLKMVHDRLSPLAPQGLRGVGR